jgi:predicted dehydrogenase/threonine dehydrogenase-like Zn-dependent dehydrogenase
VKQVVQSYRTGDTALMDVPAPVVKDHCVLIQNAASAISAGTERMIIELARKSLLGKARERPDHVRRVLQKLAQEGFFTTLAQVSAKLDEPLALGYSSAGVVLACGAGVQAFKPGDRVASNGPHAGVVCVPAHLCALLPENVPFDQAAFTVLGAIALQGVRLARLQLGETAFVIGLGIIGQLTVALLRAQGCRVLGTDPDAAKCELARTMGADQARPGLTAADAANLTRGLGADAVLITASTPSDAPVELAGEAVRKKGRIVAVGAVGLNLPRRPYYFKEAEFVVSCSYGPGRYDPEYEERGRDYPAAYVRWTEQRNMQAVLDLMGAGRLDVSPLISHRFKIERAEEAYRLMDEGKEPCIGVVIEYPDATAIARRIELKATPVQGRIGAGCIGAGNFARGVILPNLVKNGAFHPRILCSAGGLSAASTGAKLGFDVVTTDENQVIADPDVQAVFILTRHDQHAAQVVKALQAGKHVFVEKPLALTETELAHVEEALYSALGTRRSALLMVGFNRRFSPAAQAVRAFFAGVGQPLTVSIRFNAGEIPPDHWTQDEQTGGGRIIGEACHAMDLATFLAGSPPVRVFAESIGGAGAKAVTDDQCFITLRHANGSVSSIAYLAGGDRAYPKERVEVLGGGRLAVMDDFREITTCVDGRARKARVGRQDKGHCAELDAFAQALQQGAPSPIPWAELRAVTLTALRTVSSLREGIPFEIP